MRRNGPFQNAKINGASKRTTLHCKSGMIDTARAPVDDWSLAPVNNQLGEGDVHVWRASLDQPADMIAKLAPLLSRCECQRAERFHHLRDRQRFIAGRGILRKIISTYLALAPDEVRFVYNNYGKPLISDDQNRGSLSFNLSHSKGMALYAIARGRRVGVDIEYMREDFAKIGRAHV